MNGTANIVDLPNFKVSASSTIKAAYAEGSAGLKGGKVGMGAEAGLLNIGGGAMMKYSTLKFFFALLLMIVGFIVFIFGFFWSCSANDTWKDFVISTVLLLVGTALIEFFAIDQLTGFFSGNRQSEGSFRVKAWCTALLPIIMDLEHFGFSIYRLFHRK